MHDLLAKGFFPRELPPTFNSSSWADFVVRHWARLPANLDKKKGFIADTCVHSAPRQRGTRRSLGIPNPISQLVLVVAIVTGKRQLIRHINAGPRPLLSASRPVNWQGNARALIPRYALRERWKLRMMSRRAGRFVLRADISQFYGSIYTHALAWAMHTKSLAKAARWNLKLLGNRLDRAVRNGQDAQTIGIPIGPDTSLLLAEVLLRPVDTAIRTQISPVSGFRYIDDFELSFETLGDAERARVVLERVLSRFELKLNPRKTGIAEVPLEIDPPWVQPVRDCTPSNPNLVSPAEIQRLATIALEWAAAHPHDSVLKYALAMISKGAPASAEASQLMQSLAFNAMSASPVALPSALEVLIEGHNRGFQVRLARLKEVLDALLRRHVAAGQPNEIAWVLWAALVFNCHLSIPPTLVEIEDDVVCLPRRSISWAVDAAKSIRMDELDDSARTHQSALAG